MAKKILPFGKFLRRKPEEFSNLAPETMIFVAGGTRRRAVMAGIDPTSDEYPRWSFSQMMICFDHFFQHGVNHIVTHAIIPSQYQEITQGYRDKLVQWVEWNLSNAEALAQFQQRGLRVRLLGAEHLPELRPLAEKLRELSGLPKSHTIWVTVTPRDSDPWEAMLFAIHRSGAKSQKEAIRAQFGEVIPPATLYIGSGKPGIFPAVIPPLLMGKMQCYWTQTPGYITDIKTVKAVLYDFAYTRKTWKKDKTGRAEMVLDHQEIWEVAPILGLGVRLGPFWYPAPIGDLTDQEEI